jgi:hypothetical protein
MPPIQCISLYSRRPPALCLADPSGRRWEKTPQMRVDLPAIKKPHSMSRAFIFHFDFYSAVRSAEDRFSDLRRPQAQLIWPET